MYNKGYRLAGPVISASRLNEKLAEIIAAPSLEATTPLPASAPPAAAGAGVETAHLPIEGAMYATTRRVTTAATAQYEDPMPV
ncbi:MAG: hypothetical protein Q7V63_06770 [Gammaproteobacteria bacterium]|nr:hypothetical protein [Gammaproteobacteria bacterium]